MWIIDKCVCKEPFNLVTYFLASGAVSTTILGFEECENKVKAWFDILDGFPKLSLKQDSIFFIFVMESKVPHFSSKIMSFQNGCLLICTV